MSRDDDPSLTPSVGYLPAGQVIREMVQFGHDRISGLGPMKVLTLGLLGGAFITAGALLSVLLASGFTSPGPQLLVEGFGFSVGFFFVILSEAALFTEANVVMPATLLAGAAPARRVVRFWLVALIGNFTGAVVVGWLVMAAQSYDPLFDSLLAEMVETKMSFRDTGGVQGWFEAVVSGLLANWMVGMAAFFATMGRTIVGSTSRYSLQ